MMEFKVWVDGIQRVISGVNAETTCRDIVLCLAQATHQFGKFVLIEKWRNSERLLAPSESPLQLLNKWADYGNEVCFIMRRSDHHQQLQQQQVHRNGNIAQSALHPAIGTLTSGAMLPPPSTQNPPINYAHNNNTVMAAQISQHHLQSQPHVAANNANTANSSPSNIYGTYTGNNATMDANGNQSPIHQQPHQTKFISTSGPINYARANEINGEDACKNVRPKRPPPYNEAIAKSSLLQSSSPVSGQSSHSPNPMYPIQPQIVPHQPITQQPIQNTYGYTEQPYGNISNVKNANNIYGEVGVLQVISNRNANAEFDNHIKQMEMEKLRNKAMIEKRNRNDSHGPTNTIYGETGMGLYGMQKQRPWDDKEVAKLTAQEHGVINEEIQLLQREKERIEMEKNQLNSNLNETDCKIAKCRQRIQQLMDEIKGKEVTVMKNNERIKREEEMAKDQLNALKKQVYQSLQDYEDASQELNNLQKEMEKLDSDLNERKKKIEKLTTEIKEANIEGLTLLPLEDTLTGNDDENNPPDVQSADNRFGYRLGSTRRISGSPRELGNAVPTSKNPHGVWV